MSTRTRLVPILQAVTVTGLLATVAVLAWPKNTTVAPLAPSLPAIAAHAPSMPANATALTDSIVNANIFSLTREAPDARTFAAGPSDPMSDSVSTTFGDASVPADPGSTADSDPVPALYGVVDGPNGRAALLRLDASRKGSRLFQLGESAGGYRVRSIGADRVELVGPAGSVVLELAVRRVTP